jgi:hypothetical protein
METEIAAEGGKENSAAPMASALLRLAAGRRGASAARRTPILCLGRPAPRRRRSRQPLGGAGFDGVRGRPVGSGANSVFGSHRAHSDKYRLAGGGRPHGAGRSLRFASGRGDRRPVAAESRTIEKWFDLMRVDMLAIGLAFLGVVFVVRAERPALIIKLSRKPP